MTDPTPLDPDQVACPRCNAAAGAVCLTPSGAKSRTVHVERRRAAITGNGQAGQPRHNAGSTKPRRKSPATNEGRSKGGKASAQARLRRRAEAEAKIEQEKEAAFRAEVEAQAQRQAEDAVRYSRDRAILKRQTLDAAAKAATRLIESLDGFQRAVTDEDGRIQTTAVERPDRNGIPRQVEVPDVRGWANAETVERLAKVAASTLNSLRLEEGKSTGIHEQRTGVAEQLGEAGVDELLEWAARNLGTGST